MSAARFEVVHTGPYKFHARFVAANNETVWVTESYRARHSAHRAVMILCHAVDPRGETMGWDVWVREVDERDHA